MSEEAFFGLLQRAESPQAAISAVKAEMKVAAAFSPTNEWGEESEGRRWVACVCYHHPRLGAIAPGGSLLGTNYRRWEVTNVALVTYGEEDEVESDPSLAGPLADLTAKAEAAIEWTAEPVDLLAVIQEVVEEFETSSWGLTLGEIGRRLRLQGEEPDREWYGTKHARKAFWGRFVMAGFDEQQADVLVEMLLATGEEQVATAA